MRILADENIALAQAYFAPYGELSLIPGRRIDNAALREAEVLLVRSVTRVDASLLEGSPCRFVASATSGIDHIDTAYLAARGIGFGWARGCNAEGVEDYVFSALAALQIERGVNWLAGGIGIVGCGEIGARLARRCLALNMKVKIYDPLLPATHPLAAHFVSFEEVVTQRVLSVHVPLSTEGAHPTRRMFDARALAMLPTEGVFINAARGEVVDEAALLARCQRRPGFHSVLDAWQDEPQINVDLLQTARYGTPHIAGYSHGGKLRGTQMIHAQFCDYFGLDPMLASAPEEGAKVILHYPRGATLADLILQAYDLRADDAALRRTLQSADPAADFDALRRHYPLRREFSECRVQGCADPLLREAVAELGMGLLD
ncbi:MAG: 4-phosphoerythronate dehydrogenase [Pseudomonadales bacterium]|jgi:erythronate-4-phosphate dehydrogenase|nr:4-phosphoerythronate dehydrogenase [Pseudomonadales bacterium]